MNHPSLPLFFALPLLFSAVAQSREPITTNWNPLSGIEIREEWVTVNLNHCLDTLETDVSPEIAWHCRVPADVLPTNSVVQAHAGIPNDAPYYPSEQQHQVEQTPSLNHVFLYRGSNFITFSYKLENQETPPSNPQESARAFFRSAGTPDPTWARCQSEQNCEFRFVILQPESNNPHRVTMTRVNRTIRNFSQICTLTTNRWGGDTGECELRFSDLGLHMSDAAGWPLEWRDRLFKGHRVAVVENCQINLYSSFTGTVWVSGHQLPDASRRQVSQCENSEWVRSALRSYEDQHNGELTIHNVLGSARDGKVVNPHEAFQDGLIDGEQPTFESGSYAPFDHELLRGPLCSRTEQTSIQYEGYSFNGSSDFGLLYISPDDLIFATPPQVWMVLNPAGRIAFTVTREVLKDSGNTELELNISAQQLDYCEEYWEIFKVSLLADERLRWPVYRYTSHLVN